VELPLDSWWYPTAGVPGWACGVSRAASRQLVVAHCWGTRLGVWSRPPAQADPLARGKPGTWWRRSVHHITHIRPAGIRRVAARSIEVPTKEVANRNVRGFGWEMSSRGRFATPADFPLHACSPYSHVHVRRERFGFLPRSRTFLCSPVPNRRVSYATVTIRSFLVGESAESRRRAPGAEFSYCGISKPPQACSETYPPTRWWQVGESPLSKVMVTRGHATGPASCRRRPPRR
jgi:hypothetical protein